MVVVGSATVVVGAAVEGAGAAVVGGAGEVSGGAVVTGALVVGLSVWSSLPLLQVTATTPPAPSRAPTIRATTVPLRRFFGGRRVATSPQSTGAAGSMSGVSTMRTQVEETIEVIRPALQADGGDIELKDVDETTGIVSVTLVGACGTCPASTQTLKAGIERIMRDRVDGVTEVVNV